MQFRITFLALAGIIFTYSLTAQQGQALNLSLTHDGGARTYIMYIPQAYTGEEAWPLIISLHGYTATAELQRLISNFEALADAEHFLVAYPQGLEIDDPSGGALPALPPRAFGWNILDPDGPDDLGFIHALMDSISVEFSVDSAKIFVAGHSNGGALAYALACEATSRIAAIASVGGPGTSPGLVPFFECNASRPTPVLQVHGTADQVVPYTGSPGLFASIPDMVEGWANFNGCNNGPVVTEIANVNQADGSTVTLIQYLDCERDAEVWHFRVNGGGHWWPGSIEVPFFLESVFGKTNRDLDASREIWNFFSGQPLTSADEPVPDEHFAMQAFPNPFEEELSFGFALGRAGQARFSVYDQLGRRVAVFPGGELAVGFQQIFWRAPASLPAGIYLAVLEVNGKPAGRIKIIRR